jgi:hypothetical protein
MNRSEFEDDNSKIKLAFQIFIYFILIVIGFLFLRALLTAFSGLFSWLELPVKFLNGVYTFYERENLLGIMAGLLAAIIISSVKSNLVKKMMGEIRNIFSK